MKSFIYTCVAGATLSLALLAMVPPEQSAVQAATPSKKTGLTKFKELTQISTTTTTTMPTTTTTVPPTTTTVAPQPIQWDGNNLCTLVSKYDWDQATAYRICMAESKGNPNAINHNDYHAFADCYGSYGLMQLNCGWGQILDPEQNMANAYSMWKKSGFSPWSTY